MHFFENITYNMKFFINESIRTYFNLRATIENSIAMGKIMNKKY